MYGFRVLCAEEVRILSRTSPLSGYFSGKWALSDDHVDG